MNEKLAIDKAGIADFCRRHHIARLAIFGSALRDDFRPDSDVDVLVDFEPGHVPGFFRLFDIEELSVLFEGRKADLRTPEDLSRYFPDRAVAQAEVQFDVNLDIVWQTVTEDLPDLVTKLEQLTEP
jgi:predicted nucleotidyltransferase